MLASDWSLEVYTPAQLFPPILSETKIVLVCLHWLQYLSFGNYKNNLARTSTRLNMGNVHFENFPFMKIRIYVDY